MPGVFFLGPQRTIIDPNRQSVLSNQAVTASGASSVFTGYGQKEISVLIRVAGPVTGSTPTLTFTLQELDPGDQTTVLQQVVGTALVAVGNQTLTIPVTFGDTFKVIWTVTGASPSFGATYVNVVGKSTTTNIGLDANGIQRSMSVDTNGRAILVGAGTAGTHTGGVLSTQLVDVTASGTLDALNAAATVVLTGQKGVGFQLAAGTLIGTIVPEISFDGGTTWVTTNFKDPTTGAVASSVVFSSNNTATSRTVLLAAGADRARVRVSAFTSGTASAAIRATGANDPFFLFDASGALQVVVVPTSSTSGFATGTVTTAAVTNVPIRATTYTEQASNAQRSISSNNVNDTSAGTGARQVKITYYDSTGAGPFTETVTMNGTTSVATASSTICFIERMEVVSVGSGGSNAGIITLFVNNAGGGGTIGTIAVGDNLTLWTHHYVGTSKTCYITGATGNNNNSSNGTIISLRSKPIGGTAPEILISDHIRCGGGTAQPTRIYGTPIKVVGPARVVMYGAPEGSPNIITRAAFDFYEK